VFSAFIPNFPGNNPGRTPGSVNMPECILHLSGEGGGYDIEAEWEPEGSLWRFRTACSGFLGDQPPAPSPWFANVQDAVALLNSGWRRLYPSRVSAAFAKLIWAEFSKNLPNQQSVVAHWRHACGLDLSADEEVRKACLRTPPPAIARAAERLQEAAEAHMRADPEVALAALLASNLPEIRTWTESAWGKQPAGSRPSLTFERLQSSELDPLRQANRQLQSQLHARDGYHCRYCGIPVVRAEVRKFLVRQYPEASLWGRTNMSQHAALQAMWAQYDHVHPHSRGGRTSLENLVVSCAPCNFGRMEYLLEEVGLSDPRERKPVKSTWDGLERLLQARPGSAP
jgi:5-methylcytosine-specific restriction endonuclease McrA